MSKEDKVNNSKSPAVDDDDLDDLDDYLDDFADDILSKPPGYDLENENKAAPAASEPSETETLRETKTETGADEPQEDQIADLLKQLEKDSPEAKQQFETLLKDMTTLTEKTPETSTGEIEQDANLKDTISSTLNRLKQSGAKVDQSIKDEQPDQLLADLLNQLNIDGDGAGDGGDFDITKLLADMLDQLASKDILYDPLKDLSTKYPEWIEQNKSKISEEELTRYTKQSDIVKSIVDKFEEDSYSDSSKPHREFVSQKLEEMQNSGNPPDDLVGDFSKTGLPGFNFDSEDIPENLDKELEQNCAQS